MVDASSQHSSPFNGKANKEQGLPEFLRKHSREMRPNEVRGWDKRASYEKRLSLEGIGRVCGAPLCIALDLPAGSTAAAKAHECRRSLVRPAVRQRLPVTQCGAVGHRSGKPVRLRLK